MPQNRTYMAFALIILLSFGTVVSCADETTRTEANETTRAETEPDARPPDPNDTITLSFLETSHTQNDGLVGGGKEEKGWELSPCQFATGAGTVALVEVQDVGAMQLPDNCKAETVRYAYHDVDVNVLETVAGPDIVGAITVNYPLISVNNNALPETGEILLMTIRETSGLNFAPVRLQLALSPTSEVDVELSPGLSVVGFPVQYGQLRNLMRKIVSDYDRSCPEFAKNRVDDQEFWDLFHKEPTAGECEEQQGLIDHSGTTD